MPQTIAPVSLVDETRRRYLTYGMSVVTSRALPDVRDGLKPVQRRILYTMGQDLGLRPEARLSKSAKVVGQVMGTYHPHGDQAIYDAMVRLAQSFSSRYPLVHGHGNFGSLDHDPPAAMRYTEAKLQALAMELLEEIPQDTVSYRPNYDGTREEPVVLPARFPQLLVNGASGIAVGMATNIPPHNLREVIGACVALIDNSKTTLEELLDIVRGPDLPTAGEVVASREQLRQIYDTGRGALRMRATWRLEREGRQRLIIVDAVPYGVQKSLAVEKIGELIRLRKMPQVQGIRDESTDDVRIVLEVRPEADPAAVMAYLWRHTPLAETLAFNITCLVPEGDVTRPATLGLREVIAHFLDFRFLVVTRRLEHDLKKLRDRIHILEGFAIVFDALDEAIRIVRQADGRADAQTRLMERFTLSAAQADAVLETRIYRLARLEIEKILKELEARRKEARKLERLLDSVPLRWELIRAELVELAERHGDDRRTRIVEEDAEPSYQVEAFIPDEDTHVVLTRDGWIKRIARLRSATGTRVREGDEVAFVLPGSTRANVVFFSSLGSAYVMRIHDVPATSGYGEPIQKHFKFADGERVVGALSLDARVLERLLGEAEGGASVAPEANGAPSRASAPAPAPAPEVDAEADGDALAEGDGDGDDAAGGAVVEGPLVFAASAFGRVLRFALTAHAEVSQRNGRRFCRLSGPGDELVRVELCTPDKTLAVMASAKGRAIVFGLDEVSALAGPGKGVRGMKLEKGERVVACALSSGRGDALQVETTRGATHTLPATEDRRQARGGRGRELLKREGFVREVPPPIEWISLATDERGDAEAADDGGLDGEVDDGADGADGGA